MVRTIGLLLGVLFVALLPAAAQEEKVEVFGGYSYMRLRGGADVNLNGWEASAQYKFRDWIGGVADFDGHYGSIGGVGTSVHSYLFGPQVSLPSRVSPFAHVLLGGAHFSAAGSGDSAFAMAIGGGMDYDLNEKFSWRILQADYLLTRFGSSTQNNARLSTGIVYRF
jgi:opacity protein-like surface antigen